VQALFQLSDINEMTRLFINFLVLLSPFFIHISYADESEQAPVLTYGELMLIDDDVSRMGKYKQNLHFYLGFENGNPLLDIYSLSAAWNYGFGDFFEAGVLVRFFRSDKTALLSAVEDNFGLLGVEINTEPPKHSQYLTLSAIPLSGRLNYFSLRTFYYDLALTLGVGPRTTIRDTYWGHYWAIRSRVYMDHSWGLSIIFDQEAESTLSSRSPVYRNQINLGGFYQW
jgi:hypothetical protein